MMTVVQPHCCGGTADQDAPGGAGRCPNRIVRPYLRRRRIELSILPSSRAWKTLEARQERSSRRWS
eukprot:2247787-Prymnesium_polylepis.1